MSDDSTNSSITKRERFGRYLILDHLVDGGMAKICRARFLGEQADKVVAIKMVQPQFSKDEAFKTMFMDEIKLTFGLLHPNIVQTYDYGLHKGQLFVAMEYCDGRNLKEYLDKLKERKFVFPVEISTYIITQVCQGLHYAHTFSDKLTGKEANIIHRDISPHNIMLTYDGAVKVIDFGIAKSETNSESTQAGTIKGKLSYLAPEYLEGHELDPRYDEFAVGITLWEMLCSRKLFKANNDLAVLKKIQDCKIPTPSSINPNVPKELDEIVMKALHKDRNKRYDDLDQLNRALIKFLYNHYPDFNATDLSYFAKELFKQEIKADREKLFEYGKIDLRPFLDDLKREQSGGGASNSSTASDTQIRPREREQVLDFGFDEDKTADSKIRVSQLRAKKASEGAPNPASTTVGSKPAQKKEPTNKQPLEELFDEGTEVPLTVEKSTSREKTQARMSPESGNPTESKARGQKTGSGTKVKMKKSSTMTRRVQSSKLKNQQDSSKKMGVIAASLALLLGFGYFQFGDIISGLISAGSTAPDLALQNEFVPARDRGGYRVPSSDLGKFRLLNFDKYRQKVFINGIETSPDVIGTVEANINTELVIRVQQAGRKHFITNLMLEKDKETTLEIPTMQPARYGFLETSRVCVRGTLHFEVYGEKRREMLPISARGKIPFPLESGSDETNYEVYFQRSGDDIQRKFTVSIKEDRSTDFCELIN